METRQRHHKLISRIALFIILWSALWFRTAELNMTPGLSGDESFNGADAVRVLNGKFDVFFTNNFGREPLHIYSIALLMKLLGRSIYAIRLATVMYSMFGLFFAYALLKRLLDEHAALLTVGLLSLSFWPLLMGRVGLRAITLPTLETFVLYALHRGIQTERKPWLYVAGLGLGLSVYTYIPARIFVLVPVVWTVSMYVYGTQAVKVRIKALRYHLALGLLLAGLIFVPLGVFFVRYPHLANQRIGELDYTLNRILQGDLHPLLQNAVLLTKMFYIQGDSDVYYNIPGKPIFQLPVGVLFFIGIVLCVITIRKPISQLLLIWLGVMLLPALLSTGNAILRSVGALVPIYVLPVYTAASLLRALPKRYKSFRMALYSALMVVWLVLTGLSTYHDFFRVWTQLPRIREVYSAGLSHIGLSMTEMMPDDSTAVMVGCEYAADFCRDMVNFQTRYAGPIHFFKSTEAIVIPATDDNVEDILYFIGDGFPLKSSISKALHIADSVKRYTGPDGQVEGEVYRLPVSRIDEIVSPQAAISGQFRDSMAILGYDAAAQVQRGGHLDITLYWQVPESFSDDVTDPPFWKATLDDGTGRYWSEIGGILPYAVWEWSPGDLVIQHVSLPVPANVPQGSWYPQVLMYRQEGGTLVFITENGDPHRSLALDAINVVGHATTPIVENPQTVSENGDLGVVSLDLASQAAAGGELPATIDWQAIKTIEADYRIAFSIHSAMCDSEPFFTELMALSAGYPTTSWLAGEPVRSFYHAVLDPSIPNGDYKLGVSLVWTDSSGTQNSQLVHCQPLTIVGRPHFYEIPAMQVNSHISFEEGVRLLGYDIFPEDLRVKPGEIITLTLYWQTNAPVDGNYTTFAHIYTDESKGMIVAQHDGKPCYGTCPTLGWLPEEIIVDTRDIPIPVDAPKGTFPLGIGMYDALTFQRLGIPGTADNVLVLTTITIE